MTDAIVTFVEGALTSPWGLLALTAVAAVDGFFPVVPSESLVVTAGVFAAAGDQALALVVAAAAVGAFTGDHVSYASLLGDLGGAAFEDEPFKGVLLGLGVALSVGGAIELVRHARRRIA